MMDTQPDLGVAPPQTSKDKNLEIKTEVEEDTFKQVYRKVVRHIQIRVVIQISLKNLMV